MNKFNCLAVCFGLLISVNVGYALETDQFLSWGKELKNSRDVLNNYVEGMMKGRVAKLKRVDSCEKAAIKTLKVFRRPFFQIIEGFAETSPDVDVYPPREDPIPYRRQSILKKSVFPFILPMAHTLNINGVYFGSDKLGHFTSFGLRYFNVYRRALKNGASKEEAFRKSIRFGIWFERVLVGKWVSGVLSFGDIEANFQGLLFTISLCEKDAPFRLSSKGEGKWELLGKFDISPYVNPDWDESFNENAYRVDRWKGKTGVSQLIGEYCKQRVSQWVVDKFTYYRKNFEKSYSSKYIQLLEFEGKLKDRKGKTLSDVCSERNL